MRKAPKFPKRFSREKRKKLRAEWIEAEQIRIAHEIAMRVWAKFPEILVAQIEFFSQLPPLGIYKNLKLPEQNTPTPE